MNHQDTKTPSFLSRIKNTIRKFIHSEGELFIDNSDRVTIISITEETGVIPFFKKLGVNEKMVYGLIVPVFCTFLGAFVSWWFIK